MFVCTLSKARSPRRLTGRPSAAEDRASLAGTILTIGLRAATTAIAQARIAIAAAIFRQTRRGTRALLTGTLRESPASSLRLGRACLRPPRAGDPIALKPQALTFKDKAHRSARSPRATPPICRRSRRNAADSRFRRESPAEYGMSLSSSCRRSTWRIPDGPLRSCARVGIWSRSCYRAR